LPSVGISLGEVVSEVFQIRLPFNNNLSSFCDVGVFTQYAKNLLMVIVPGLLLVISITRSLPFGLVMALRDTEGQNDPAGAIVVGVGVNVGVEVRVFVLVGGTFVGVGDFVDEGIGVSVGERVGDGRTKSVFVGAKVIVGMPVKVWVGISVGVEVI
jgi:hypothetical protein